MNKTIYVNWNGHHIKLTWIPTDKKPEIEKVTSVHGFCFDGERFLLVHVAGRGFNIPGGHIEKGETPEQDHCKDHKKKNLFHIDFPLLSTIIM